MQHDFTQVSANFPRDLFKRGEHLANSGAVFDFNARNQGIVISARVKDNPSDPNGEIHRVFINVNPNIKTPFAGECSCDLGENCEHVVASLIAALNPRLITTAGTPPSETNTQIAGNSTSSNTSTSNTSTSKKWLDNLRSQRKSIDGKPALAVFYDLTLTTRFGYQQLSLSIFAAIPHLTAEGDQSILTDIKPLNIGRYTLDKPARYMAKEDSTVFSWLLNNTIQREIPNPLDITYLADRSLLTLLNQTERCQLLDGKTQTTTPRLHSSLNEENFTLLKSGQSRHLHPLWHINSRGEQWLSLSRPKQGIGVFGVEEPFYLDSQADEWGALEVNLDPPYLQSLLEGIILSPMQVAQLRKDETKTQTFSNGAYAKPYEDLKAISKLNARNKQKNTQLNVLTQALDQHVFPPPLLIKNEVLDTLEPKPILQLYSKRISKVVDRSYRVPALIDGVAVYFVYTIPSAQVDSVDENPLIRFHFRDDKHQETRFFHGTLYTIKRNIEAETSKIDQLLKSVSGLLSLDQIHDVDWDQDSLNYHTLKSTLHGDPDDHTTPLHQKDFGFLKEHEWEDFLLEDIPLLKREGWDVRIEEDFRHHFAKVESWYGDIQKSNHKWFDLEMGILIDGERINLLPILLNQIQNGNPLLSLQSLTAKSDHSMLNLPLPDGRIVPLPVGRLRRMLSVFVEMYDSPALNKAGKIRLASSQAPRLGELALEKDLEEDQELIEWHGEKSLFETAQKLRTFTSIETVAIPDHFNAELRDYQKAGLNWLHFLGQYDLGGILADDMGLGKTVQTLALITHEKQSGRLNHPALVIAPTSVLSNWRREAEQFSPQLRVLVFHGPKRFQHQYQLAKFDLIITSYALINRDLEMWQSRELHYLILDEAHHIKNRKAKVASAIRKFNATHRLCLTGTPMENHLGELWSLFDFLMPKFLGNEKEFRANYRNPIEKQNDEARAAALAQRIAPFLLRRTKSQVATELPPKTEIIKTIAFDEEQLDLYESIRLSMNQRVREAVTENGIEKSQILILDALLKLRQVCCDPALLKLEQGKQVGSAKLAALMEMLSEMVEEGRRILIFSQFTSMLENIEIQLKKVKYEYVKLTGATRNRDLPIDRFQSGEVPIFLLSLKAGGTGLNLTAADTVIHYDPWWNPAAENQATDRAYRIGQDKPVFVYKLLMENSIEEAIYRMQQDKMELTQSMYQDSQDHETPLATDLNKPFNLNGEELAALLQDSQSPTSS